MSDSRMGDRTHWDRGLEARVAVRDCSCSYPALAASCLAQALAFVRR
jgi:hypothetical protein